MKKLKVVELFAGVGGFRVALERTGKYEVIWSNQWEPSTVKQHASLVYENVFGKNNHCNKDIESVKTEEIPDCDVLVGGFPCQDYSVATSLKNSGGIQGKKGVLWWSIDRILKEKTKKPSYLILENVDRLLKSPVNQRGRDFAIMLKCLNENNYAVEWRVINAADYGFPQRRKRIFIVAYHKNTEEYKKIQKNKLEWILKSGTISKSFPIFNQLLVPDSGDLTKLSIIDISKNFNLSKKTSPFHNTGVFIDNEFITFKSLPDYRGQYTFLKDILEKEVNDKYYIDENDIDRWMFEKGAKKKRRVTKEGFEYMFSEGKMTFPDDLNKASRTIITGEGGTTPSRFKHVVEIKSKLRRLTPVELERLNGFDDNHTKLDGITDNKRAFFMGNALVIGIVQKIGDNLI